jgi:serine/threonine-protein kinase
MTTTSVEPPTAPTPKSTATTEPNAAGTPGAQSGEVSPEGSASGRRVYIDDRVMGQTPAAFIVPCGTHKVQVGSAGQPQTITVPCGGRVVVAR